MYNSQHQRQSQQQKHGYYMSQQHLKLMHLMHLSGFALQEYLENQIELNPALEIEKEEAEEEEIKPEEEDTDFLMNADDDYYDKSHSKQSNAQDFYEAPVIHFNTLQESIREQLQMTNMSAQQTELAFYIVGELEDDGFLRRSTEEIAYDYGFAKGKNIRIELIESAILAIQQCEPAGVGARNLQECLRLQIERKPFQYNRIIRNALNIINKKYHELTQHHLEEIKNDLDLSQDDLEKSIRFIAKLSPKPFTESNKYELLKQQIIPDFEVSSEDNRLTVSLTSSEPMRVKVNEEYIHLLNNKKQDHKKKQTGNYFQQLISDAQQLVNALRDRETTMLNVMKVIAEIQQDFFRSGDKKDLKPMILQDVAEKTGFDISAVSRITSNKHVQTPYGIFCLKNLFMRAVSQNENNTKSNTSIQVQELIHKIVQEENKESPLSDSEIMEILKQNKVNVARRTIVKYRELSGIPNSATRKKKTFLV